MKTFIILAALIAVTQAWKVPGIHYPWHASCKIEYEFSKTNCKDVQDKLVSQIEEWKDDSNCGTGQKCLYTLKSNSDGKIVATHTTPKARYIDDMHYSFIDQPGGACGVKAFSESRLWYALLDKGTNFCNLHNLIEGAGLHTIEGFLENTRNKVCTQYSTRNCEIY